MELAVAREMGVKVKYHPENKDLRNKSPQVLLLLYEMNSPIQMITTIAGLLRKPSVQNPQSS